MSRFIKLNCIGQQVHHDTISYVHVDCVQEVTAASSTYKISRPEINALVTKANGQTLAVSQNIEQVMDEIDRALL